MVPVIASGDSEVTIDCKALGAVDHLERRLQQQAQARRGLAVLRHEETDGKEGKGRKEETLP